MIDLRSDTVTRPTEAMRQAMARAEVGDDVWGDDPTVNALEAKAAALLGKEAALYVASGTQSNLVALLSHCQRGEEFIVGHEAHIYKYEVGGAAALGGLQPQPLMVAADGTISLDAIRNAVKPDDVHFAVTRLLCLENTIYGRVLSLDYIQQACALADSYKLNKHLDGARLFNAAVKTGVDAKEIAAGFDTVSVCLSKGLGAPVGSVLCGSKALIKRARRWRKMLGGGMRQAGIIAAAGIYALDHNIERLREDHDNAYLLAVELSDIAEITIDHAWVQTNMVFITPAAGTAQALGEYLHSLGILVDCGTRIRMVTHMQVSREDVLETAAAIRKFYKGP
jgi:threonine aldolase